MLLNLGRCLLLILALTSCTSREAADVDLPDGDPEAGADGQSDSARLAALPPGCDDLAETILDPRPTRDRLRSRFGAPDSVHVVDHPNRHTPGVVDSIFDVYYPGLLVAIHKPGGGNDLVSGATVEDNRYLAYPRIGIGAPEDSVVAALGPSTDRAPGTLTYSCGMGAEQPVHFDVRDGRVQRVRVEFYVD